MMCDLSLTNWPAKGPPSGWTADGWQLCALSKYLDFLIFAQAKVQAWEEEEITCAEARQCIQDRYDDVYCPAHDSCFSASSS